MPRWVLVALLAVLAGPATAYAERDVHVEGEHGSALERAKEEHGVRSELRATRSVAGAVIRAEPAEWVAGAHQEVRLSIAGAPAGAQLRIDLPAPFGRRAASGLRFTTGTDTLTARVGADGAAEVSFRDLGLPARPYAAAFSLRAADGSTTDLGRVGLRVYSPPRESEAGEAGPWATLEPPRLAKDATADTDEESETFIAMPPRDPDRIVVGYNDIDDITKGPSVSNDGGQTFKQLTQPNAFDVAGKTEAEKNSVSGDPMLAADTLGNVWFGGLSTSGGDGPSRIFVNRIDRQTGEFQPRTVGLENLHDGQQDKPMMTVDNSPSSPTYGRIYIVWDDPGDSGVNEVIVFCDTRVGGLPAYERCDDADNWTKPVKVLANEGSFIYADVAVAPDGTVYFTTWDWSAENAIVGAVCRAEPRTRCGTEDSFSEPHNVAVLEAFPGTGGVPFGCPTFSAPGGRTGPVPSVEVDTSGGPENGRVWVAWGDLRADSGTTRCEFSGAAGTPPAPTNMTWDVFAATAAGDLPIAHPADATSSDVGTKVSDDTGGNPVPNSAENSDDFFPWLAVDGSTGQAWVDWYATAGDDTRMTADFMLAPLTPASGTKPAVGTRRKVNATRSDYSTGTTACCIFGNDYGDYTGVSAAQGTVVPVWTSRADGNDDGDALIAIDDRPHLQLTSLETDATEGPGADGDGVVEPGEQALVTETVFNPSKVGATDVTGTLSTAVSGASVQQAVEDFIDVPPGFPGFNLTPFLVTVPASAPCGSRVDFRLDLATAQEPETVPVLVTVGCNGTVGSAPGPPATTTPAPTAARPGASLAVDRMRLRSVLRRGLRLRVRCTAACTTIARVDVSRATARRLHLHLRTKPLGRARVRLTRAGRRVFRLRLSRTAVRALRRSRRVTLVIAADAQVTGRTTPIRLRRNLLARR